MKFDRELATKYVTQYVCHHSGKPTTQYEQNNINALVNFTEYVFKEMEKIQKEKDKKG